MRLKEDPPEPAELADEDPPSGCEPGAAWDEDVDGDETGHPFDQDPPPWLGFVLALVAAAITIAVAHGLAPAGRLTIAGYCGWLVAGCSFYLTMVMQNTVEGCVALVILGAGLIVLKQVLPPHILWPIITAIASATILSRIERRVIKGVWIE